MDDVYSVLPCLPGTLKDILSKKSTLSSDQLDRKLHVRYFEDYFRDVNAKTIVLENNYIDHDYTEDHAEYYVRCFKSYKRKCTRLHIFKNEFTCDDFDGLLAGEDANLTAQLLKDNYLGFIVVKPLPRTVFGRTCLEIYPDQGTRYFPITRSYSANLFGIQLTVRKSLAFQEQDNIVAACATSALWSIFQGTGILFQHAIPSPSAITKAATEHITDGERTRAFPSKGLDVIEMARAIKKVELEPYTVSVKNEYLLKSTSYAYLHMGIPMILGFPLYDTYKVPHKDMGKHAVSLTGYNLPNVDPVPFGSAGFKLRANKIDKLYAHDDQIGPFARMEFDDQPVILDINGLDDLPSLSTSWPDVNDKIGGARAVPELLLLPLYHKIRIPYGCIHDQIMIFDTLFDVVASNHLDVCGDYEWDIYLTTVNEYKSELLENTDISPNIKNRYLISGMPKYIWRASVVNDKRVIIDILFDATDLEQGSYVDKVIGYSGDVYDDLKNHVLNSFNVDKSFFESRYRKTKVWPLLEWFRENL